MIFSTPDPGTTTPIVHDLFKFAKCEKSYVSFDMFTLLINENGVVKLRNASEQSVSRCD